MTSIVRETVAVQILVFQLNETKSEITLNRVLHMAAEPSYFSSR